MTGIDWSAVGRETFDEIVDVLLGREFGSRGHAVNGRGGDEGIDYSVDDSKMIFQYKYFPDGFPVSGTRRTQIRKSFRKAICHDPNEWILVVPATVTPPERKFVTGLGKGKQVRISIRDRTWLNTALIENRDVAEHYRYGTDVDYLFAKGERFKQNPVVRDMDDVVDRVRSLQDSIATADPNWALDFYSIDGGITQVLRAKDARAAERSPIQISFTAEVPAGSPEEHELVQAHAFGPVKSIVLPGEMVKNFRVTGPRLVAREDDGGIDRLEWHPMPDPDSWRPSEIVLSDGEEEQLGTYLAEVRLAGEGQLGLTVQARVGRHVEISFRCPHDKSLPGTADWTAKDVSGIPVGEVFEAADFVVQVARAATLEIWVEGTRVAQVDMTGRMVGSDFVEGFDNIRATAEDLNVIEAETRARFRYPSELSIVERIMIRNLRLMLEGHCVAHPTHDRLSATLTGFRSEALDQVLTTDYGWWMHSARTDLTILGQRIPLRALNVVAVARLAEQINVEELKAGIAGRTINLELRPGDRVRMFLPDRMPPDRPVDITPWGLNSVRQAGLGADGTPLH